MDNRHADGQHHHSSSCVGNPHREESRRHHESQDNFAHVGADEVDDVESDALVEIPFFDGKGDDETTDEQKDKPVREGGRGSLQIQSPGEWKQYNGQQGSHRNGDRFGYPPNRYPKRGS